MRLGNQLGQAGFADGDEAPRRDAVSHVAEFLRTKSVAKSLEDGLFGANRT
jgi:hypothetical protein